MSKGLRKWNEMEWCDNMFFSEANFKFLSVQKFGKGGVRSQCWGVPFPIGVVCMLKFQEKFLLSLL